MLAAERAQAGSSAPRAKPTFRELAHAWLEHLETVDDAKPSTLTDYRALLREPDVPYQRGGGRTLGRIMRRLGDLPAADITREHIDALLTELDKQPISRRTINKHRAILHAAFSFSRSPDQRARWGVEQNPVTDTRKRREEDPGHLEVFTVEQIEALARAAENGIWRSERTYVAVNTEHLRRQEDRELADLLRIAAYTGLRKGELVALRWEDVSWAERVLIVRRTLSGTEERSTKSRRIRYVPLADQALAALDRISQRPNFTGPRDYVLRDGRRRAARSVRTPQALRRLPRRRRTSAASLPRPTAHGGQPAGPSPRPGHGQGHHGPRGPGDDRAIPARDSRDAIGRPGNQGVRAPSDGA